jgi:hypothetical protein
VILNGGFEGQDYRKIFSVNINYILVWKLW